MVNRIIVSAILILVIQSCHQNYYPDLRCNCESDAAIKQCLNEELKFWDRHNLNSDKYIHKIERDSSKVRYKFVRTGTYDTIPPRSGIYKTYLFDFDPMSGECIYQITSFWGVGRNDRLRHNFVDLTDSTSLVNSFKSAISEKQRKLIEREDYMVELKKEGSYYFLSVIPKNWFERNTTDKTKKKLMGATIRISNGRIERFNVVKQSNYRYGRSRF